MDIVVAVERFRRFGRFRFVRNKGTGRYYLYSAVDVNRSYQISRLAIY